MGLLVFYVLLALGVSFICSILEAVLLSVTPGFIKTEVSEGKPYAEKLEKMKCNLDEPISAILTFNTIAHTMGAAGAGAQWMAISGNVGEAYFSAVLTGLVLVFSEIIPKTIGATFWRGLAAPSTVILRWMIFLLYITGTLWTLKWVTKLLGGKSESHGVSRSELAAMAEISSEGGHIDDEETEILRNLFQLRSTKVRDIMTPRIVVYARPATMTAEEFLNEAVTEPFSRVPVYDSNLDDINGFVLKSDVMGAGLHGHAEGKTLDDYRRPIAAVPSTVSVYQAFKQMSEDRSHIMLVIDEFGGMEGLVTMEDIVETLLGMEIIDEADRSEDMQQVARKLWQQRAQAMGLQVDKEGNAIVADESSTTIQ